MTTNQPSEIQKNNSLTTLNAGVLDRFKINAPLSFETGLLLEGKGSKIKINISEEDAYTAKFNPFYLEVPANLVYRFTFPKKMNLFIDAGPYIAMGIFGQTKSKGNIGGVDFSNTSPIDFSNANTVNDDIAYSNANRFDYGINLGAGLDFRKMLLKVDYGFGLSQVNVNQIDPVSSDINKNRVLSISLGVPFKL